MYSNGVAASLLGVCVKTLRRWDHDKKIYCIRTLGGHQRFPISEIRRILEGKSVKDGRPNDIALDKEVKSVIYARVPSHKQKKQGDLKRQIRGLENNTKKLKLKIHKVYQDVGSGLNTKRKGLWGMIKDAREGKFTHLFVNNKDPLTRFGYKYLKQYLEEFEVKITCANKLDEKSPQSELQRR